MDIWSAFWSLRNWRVFVLDVTMTIWVQGCLCIHEYRVVHWSTNKAHITEENSPVPINHQLPVVPQLGGGSLMNPPLSMFGYWLPWSCARPQASNHSCVSSWVQRPSHVQKLLLPSSPPCPLTLTVPSAALFLGILWACVTQMSYSWTLSAETKWVVELIRSENHILKWLDEYHSIFSQCLLNKNHF